MIAGKHLGYNYTMTGTAPYGDHWRNVRRISTLELLSSHRLKMLSGIRSDEVRALILRLFKSRNQAVDMKSAFFELALNVIMRMIGGKRYCGENVGDAEEARKIQDMVSKSFRLAGTDLVDFLPLLGWLGLTQRERRLMEVQKMRDGFIQNLIEEYRSRRSKSECGTKTMIEVLLSLQETEPENYTDVVIKGLLLVRSIHISCQMFELQNPNLTIFLSPCEQSLLSAGTDTSSVALEWALSLLLNNPAVLNKAHQEIHDRLGDDRLIEESDLAHLPYLGSIIKETMRIHPPGPLLVPHESLRECFVGGFRVPKGTMLLVNAWAIQNDPKLWEKPAEFRPERFEGEDGEGEGLRYLPFGSGRRGCPGEGLAMRMVGLALGSLIQCFDWERVGKEMVDMAEGAGLVVSKAQHLVAWCRPRPNMYNLLSQLPHGL